MNTTGLKSDRSRQTHVYMIIHAFIILYWSACNSEVYLSFMTILINENNFANSHLYS